MEAKVGAKWGQSGGKKSPFGGKNSQKEHYAVGKKTIIKAKSNGSIIKSRIMKTA